MNELALIQLLQNKIGKNIIINNQPDKSNTCLVRKVELFAYFNDSQLEKYFKTPVLTIKLSDFIEYMIYSNKSTHTKGLYHQYMPYIHTYYTVPIDRSGFPNYSNLDDTISKKIVSSRPEYSILHGLLYFIDQDKYLKNKIRLTYQFKLDNKYFDACIPDLKILIEIQEDKDNHDNKTSDNHKKLIAKFNEYYIIYFHESDLKKDEMSLKNFFNNKFKKVIYGAMSYYNKEQVIPIIRELYVEKLNEDLKEATSVSRKNKIKESIRLFETNYVLNKLIEKKFANQTEKYFLTLSDIYSVYPDLEKNNDFKKDMSENILYNKITRNQEDYFEWSLMNYVIVEYSDTKNDCACYLKFLTELDGLYRTLLIYNNEYLEQCKISHQECKEYYDKLESDELVYYKQELKSTEKRLLLIEKANQVMLEKFKQNSFITSLTRILESPFKRSSEKALGTILNDLKSIQETIKIIQESNSPTEIKCQKVVGKSIVENKSDFPYVYNPESEGIVYKQLYTDMKTLLLSDTDIYNIVKQFCPFFNSEKTEIIYNVSLKEDYNKFSITQIEDLLEQTHIGKVDSDSEESNILYPHPESDTDLEEADF
jgi:hypothetical protein